MDNQSTFEWIERNRDWMMDLADQIWETPELPLQEFESSEILIQELEGEGFEVEKGVGGLPTAFRASYGDGDPKIGILGEYDALPGHSQKIEAEREPVEPGAPGHGCGHNLYGVGSLAGAIAAKQRVDEDGLEGTIVYYGCPAEETLVGKVYMARGGAFRELDAVLRWHPHAVTTPTLARSNALDSVKYHFEGESSHPATNPESGRSALDAVQLMNMAAEFMREHVSEKARIHYSVLEGGNQPNVMPSEAVVWYYVRAPSREEVEEIREWLDDVAKGSTFMTQTSVEIEYITGCYPRLPNDALADVLWENMRKVGPIEFTDEERQLASDLQETISDGSVTHQVKRSTPEHLQEEISNNSLYPSLLENYDRDYVKAGTADSNNVSWITPKGKFQVTAWPVGVPAHSWQATAANGSFGKRSAVFASKVLAATALDLISDPDTLSSVRSEFEERLGGRSYECPLPEDADPPLPSDAGSLIPD